MVYHSGKSDHISLFLIFSFLVALFPSLSRVTLIFFPSFYPGHPSIQKDLTYRHICFQLAYLIVHEFLHGWNRM